MSVVGFECKVSDFGTVGSSAQNSDALTSSTQKEYSIYCENSSEK